MDGFPSVHERPHEAWRLYLHTGIYSAFILSQLSPSLMHGSHMKLPADLLAYKKYLGLLFVSGYLVNVLLMP